jgi:hypothetical protein
MSTAELLGVTTCPTCQKRFRVPKKYESFIGKEIQCPKCKRPFVIELEKPAPIEQAAMATAAEKNGQEETAAKTTGIDTTKKKKRTKAEIRKAAYKKIKKEFGPYMRQLEAISECESNSEEKIRVWCIGVLKGALGYQDEDLDFELSAGKGKIDIAVKHENKVILAIECKKPGTLPSVARKAALTYAAVRSADWAAVTNGQIWELHRVIPVDGENPRSVELFNISLLDDDGLSQYDVERMYLLTKKALLRGETEKEFHRAQCFDKNRVFAAMLSDRVIAALRRSLTTSYKKEYKESVKLSDDDVFEELKDLIRPEEL